MADPLGIAGTAAGLVSLGLQLYGEISKYIKAVKGRDEDLRAARQNAEVLRKCLNAIKGATSSTNVAQTASKDAVEECVASCIDELKQLDQRLTRLRGSTTPADSLSAKVKAKGRQLMYPFHKDDIVDLERRLASANDVLQAALHALGINVSLTMQSAVVDLQSDTTAIKLLTKNNSKQLLQVSNVVEDIRDSGHLIPEIHAQTASTSLSMVQQTQALAQSTQISIRVEENTQMIRQQVDSRMGRFEELLTQLVAANSAGRQSTQKQFGQLLARPSDLRTLCDGFLSDGTTLSSSSSHLITHNVSNTWDPTMGYRPCPCMRRRNIQRHERYLGPLVFETETSNVKHHAPECHYALLKPFEQNTRIGLSITIPGVQMLLQKAIRVSFFLGTGTGGLSWGQNVSWIATVDPKLSPAFRIADTAVGAIKSGSLTAEECQAVLESCWRRIFWCYAQKTASATDVDQNGITILGKFVNGTWAYDPSGVNVALFVRHLVAFGLSVNCRTGAGFDEPIYTTIVNSAWAWKQEAVHTMIDVLNNSSDPEDEYSNAYSTLLGALDTFKLFHNFPDFAKRLHFGSLMIGIMRQDLGYVSHLLNTSPLSVHETNYCGQTPVHIAVLAGNASILKLVLSFSNEKLLHMADSYDHYPIEYVTPRQMHKACHSQRVSICEGCMMLEALLNAGSVLFTHALQLGLGGEDEVSQNLSFPVREILLRHLKERRMRLQDLAIKQLTKGKRRGLISPANYVLDRNATRVQKLLEDQSTHIPWHLKVYNRHENTEISDSPGTIYGYICDRTTAKLAWKLGFRDVGIDFMDGLNQVLRGVLTSSGTHEQASQTISGYISWLVDRGLDLKMPIPATLLPEGLQQRPDLRTTGAHYLMRLFGDKANFRDKTVFKLPEKLSAILFSQFAVDSCSCRCSPSGCNPLMKYFDYFRYESTHSSRGRLDSSPKICKTALGLITPQKWRSPSFVWIYQAVLRRITFDVLSLRHSCCDLISWREPPDQEATAESWVEDEDRLLLFENLCVEFEAKCGGNSKLVQFVRDTWHPRMMYELERLENQEMERKMTAEERLEAEEIGVNWDSDSSDTSTSEKEDDGGALGYFTRMLDDIAPEPDIQVPYGFILS